MDVNADIQVLETITGLPVSPDIYSGNADKYIVYSCSDERPVLWGDDEPMEDQVIIQVNLFTPPKFNYMDLKHQIRDYLETLGEISEISSWLDTFTAKNNLEVTIRHTTFSVIITKER
ncbi:MAG: hypothetical protein IJT37_10155 [Lachnospiraceae bacterium]|nr:hypothetical protein [Lachnospiraceae bacterium]